MTKEITKSILLQQIEDQLKLREWEAARFLFSETVIPVFDLREQIQEPAVNYQEMAISAAPVGILFFTVPVDERWYLNRYNVVFMAAGAYTVTGVYVHRKKEKRYGSFIYFDMVAGQSVSYTHDLPNPVRLDSGDKLYIYIDGYTSPADLRLYIDYIVEVVR